MLHFEPIAIRSAFVLGSTSKVQKALCRDQRGQRG